MQTVIFHHVARAVIVDQGHVLIARFKGKHCFLPGGHVEPGELVEEALQRELHEELGLTDARIGRFLGTCELLLELEDGLNQEIAHLFEVETGFTVEDQPVSPEEHLEFFWTELSRENLQKVNVLPYLVPQVLPRMVQGDKPLWASGNQGVVRIKEEGLS